MVNKVPEIRLGGSYAALKGNPWFDTLDWVWIQIFINLFRINY